MNDDATPTEPGTTESSDVEAVECGWPATSKLGAKGKKVEALQTVLAERGWYAGTIDGDYGDITQQGVQKMQQVLRSFKVRTGPIDGQYDDDTRHAACISFPI